MKLSSAILAAGFAAFSSHLAAEEVFVTAVGLKQGPFAGEISMKGFENKVRAVAFWHEVLTATDATGRRQHRPIVITKRAGASSPQFFQAWANNEPFKTLVIDFTDTEGSVGAASTRRLVYRITLENAVVVRIAQRLDAAATPVPAGGTAHPEDISLAYQAITVTFPQTGRTATDSVSR